VFIELTIAVWEELEACTSIRIVLTCTGLSGTKNIDIEDEDRLNSEIQVSNFN
jgi:hypothetical protein